MGNQIDSDYWDFMYQIMEYSVDSSTAARLLLEGRQVAIIDESLFLEKLYSRREDEKFEEKLVNQLLSSLPILCIAAGRGSGKTSAIRYAADQIRSLHPRVKVLILDIKSLYDQRRFQAVNEQNASQSFAEFMRTEVQSRLFPLPHDTREFLAWALAGSPDESDNFEHTITSDLHDASNYVIAEAGLGDDGHRMERFEAIKTWFNSHQARYANLLREVSPKLRTAHVVRGAITLRNLQKLVLIYDNVDRIPSSLQPRFLEVAHDSQIAMGPLCTTAIAIRGENIRRATPRAGEGGDIIHVLLPNEEEYPCVLLPRFESSHVQKVLEKRYLLSMNLYQANLSKRDLHQLAALKISPVHLGVVSEFVSNSIHALANGSMRNIVAIYIGFMRYLRTLESRGVLNLDEIFDGDVDDERHLRTLFFLWLREKGNSYGVFLYDVLKVKDLDSDIEEFSSLASEHHFLMTCILNLTIKMKDSNAERFPRFSAVFEYMSELGFSLAQMKAAVRDLCAAPGDQPSIIEFYTTECNIENLTAHSEDPVRLTILGEELIRGVCSKVGYVWGTAYHDLSAKAKGRISYHTLTKAERISIFYDYMRKMVTMHLKLLSLLQPEWSKAYGDTWLKRYRRRFGVGERLQVERILESAISFFRGSSSLITLLEAYSALQDKVKSGQPFHELDLSELDRGRELIEGRTRRKA